MELKDVIIQDINTGAMVCNSYLDDLTDEEMMQRPHPGCNHIKWQVGHLIASEHMMVESVAPGTMPKLPAGFAEKYTKETAGSDDPSAFDSKDELMRVFKEQRDGTLASLGQQTDESLSSETPDEQMRSYCPTVSAAYAMQGAHWLMHCGQWVVLRRQLGREIVI